MVQDVPEVQFSAQT